MYMQHESLSQKHKTPMYTTILTVGVGFLMSGCKSPLDHQMGGGQMGNLYHLLETEEIVERGLSVSTQTTTPEIEAALIERMDELTALTPVGSDLQWPVLIGTSLGKLPLLTTTITAEEAVLRAVTYNLDLEIARLQPVISQQSLIEAEAAFDFVLGAGVSNHRSKIPQQQTLVGGSPLGTPVSTRDIRSYEASLAKKLTSGGVFTLSTDLTKTDSTSSGFTYDPNPSWQSIGTIDFKQPLMRGFGEKVVLAEVKLARNATNKSIQAFRESLHKVITDTEIAYLHLALQWRTLQVQEWLLQEGESVVEILELRRAYDTSEADYAQAVATVKQRASDVISQQASVLNASDQLKKLMNDPGHAIETSSVLAPNGVIEVENIYVSLRDTILSAAEQRPDLQNLKMAVDDQSIRVRVAKNAMLPQLDLQAQLSFYGLDSGAGGSYEEVFDRDYLNHLVGLSYEYPLGNRLANAQYKSSRLQRIASIAAYNKGLQQVILEVKEAMRNVATNAKLVSANKSFRIAQAENLRALQVEEETLSGLTPTFLNLKLQTQAGLANARIAEFTSAVNFNKALATLYMAAGTTLEMHQISLDDVLSMEY